ncbi:hypothetical protein VCRA2123O286_540002 [Vibrio crassostreae]|nr:hypothetical protein VCRA2123O286_540002 [Vibrio crassostreae]
MVSLEAVNAYRGAFAMKAIQDMPRGILELITYPTSFLDGFMLARFTLAYYFTRRQVNIFQGGVRNLANIPRGLSAQSQVLRPRHYIATISHVNSLL